MFRPRFRKVPGIFLFVGMNKPKEGTMLKTTMNLAALLLCFVIRFVLFVLLVLPITFSLTCTALLLSGVDRLEKALKF